MSSPASLPADDAVEQAGPAVAISATFTAEPLEAPLRFWLQRLKLELDVAFAPFHQVFQTLLDPGSLFGGNRGGLNVVLLRWEDFGSPAQIEEAASQLSDAVRGATATGTPLVVVTCAPSPGWLSEAGHAALYEASESRLAASLASVAGVHFIGWQEQQGLYPVEEFYDDASDRLAHLPYTPLYFAALATVLARRIDLLKRPPFKVVALDLDNTVWQGIVGEDGPAGIKLDEGRLMLQRFMTALQQDGILLTLCSKNNLDDALEAFRLREEMPLRLEHLAAWQINWEPKSSNLQALAAQLNLGLDSFVFLDDSGHECAEVRTNAPAVTVLRLPEASEDIPAFLRHVWAFDHLPATAEDRQRTASYQQERERGEMARQAGSLAHFLASLELIVEIEPMGPDQLARVAQLTQRTNQFNCTTIRRTEADIQALLASGTMECATVSVRDRFGDYGLVGAVLFGPAEGALRVDSFLLSCRALGRGVEHRIVRHLGELAQSRGWSRVDLPFRPTAKNAPARQFLEQVAAAWKQESGEDTVYAIPAGAAAAAEYKPREDASATEAFVEDKAARPKAAKAIERPDYDAWAREFRSAADVLAALEQPTASGSVQTGPGAPRDAVERELAALWAEALRLPAVGIHDNFFELGGHSLLAVQLLSKVIRRFANEAITMSSLLQAPTVAQFAALLQNGGSAEFRSLVPMRSAGTRPPFYCVHGAGGNVVSMRDLAMAMPADQPFYCLQARGLDGSEPFGTVEETAAHYVQEIRSFQPEGPYFLGGGCYGGLVAFEMARQLVEAGQQVAFLTLIDTYNHAHGNMLPKPVMLYCNARFLLQRVGHHLARFAELPAGEWFSYLGGRARTMRRRMTAAAAVATGRAHHQAFNEPLPDLPQESFIGAGFHAALQRVREANLQAEKTYWPKPYSGSLVLFRAGERMIEPYQDRYLGWRRLAQGGIQDHEIPGNHVQITADPYVRVLAEQLDQCLKQAQAKA